MFAILPPPPPNSRKVFDRLMRVIDSDQSGTIDYDEFIALVYSDNETLLEILRRKIAAKCSDGPADSCTPAQARAVHRRLREVFDSFDSQLSGELPMQAFAAALERLDVHLSPDLIKQLLTMFDADRSGSIDFDEFAVAMMTPQALEHIEGKPPPQPKAAAAMAAEQKAQHSAAGGGSIVRELSDVTIV